MSARHTSAKIGSSNPSYATQLVVGHHHLVADEPVDLGGGDTGPAPDELVLAALGACTAITLRMYAQRKQWPLESVEVSLDFESRTKEKAVIRRTVHLTGPLDAEQRERLLQIANACPVHKLLSNPIGIATALA